MSNGSIVKIINNQSSIIWPSIKSGPYSIEVIVDCIGTYKISLCVLCSKSYSRKFVEKNYSEKEYHLIPHHRFLDKNDNIIDDFIIYPENLENIGDGKYRVFFDIYYIDDMPTAPYPLYLQAEITTIDIKCLITTTTESSSESNHIAILPLWVNEWLPRHVKFTRDGIHDINSKWSTLPINWYATLHDDLYDICDHSPIIFSFEPGPYESLSNTLSTSLNVNPSSNETNCCIDDNVFRAFDITNKNTKFGWIEGECVSDSYSLTSSVSGAVNIDYEAKRVYDSPTIYTTQLDQIPGFYKFKLNYEINDPINFINNNNLCNTPFNSLHHISSSYDIEQVTQKIEFVDLSLQPPPFINYDIFLPVQELYGDDYVLQQTTTPQTNTSWVDIDELLVQITDLGNNIFRHRLNILDFPSSSVFRVVDYSSIIDGSVERRYCYENYNEEYWWGFNTKRLFKFDKNADILKSIRIDTISNDILANNDDISISTNNTLPENSIVNTTITINYPTISEDGFIKILTPEFDKFFTNITNTVYLASGTNTHTFTISGKAESLHEAYKVINSFNSDNIISSFIYKEQKKSIKKIILDSKYNIYVNFENEEIYKLDNTDLTILDSFKNLEPQNLYDLSVNDTLLSFTSSGVFENGFVLHNITEHGTPVNNIITNNDIYILYDTKKLYNVNTNTLIALTNTSPNITIDKNNNIWYIDNTSIKSTSGISKSLNVPNNSVLNLKTDHNNILWIVTKFKLFGYDIDNDVFFDSIDHTSEADIVQGDWTGIDWFKKYANDTVSISATISGCSNDFKIREFEPEHEIRKHNESWEIVDQLKEYAMAPHLNTLYNLWNNFMGGAIGGVEPVWSVNKQLGRTVYEKIANYLPYHVDIDDANLKQFYSITQYMDVPIDDYDLEYPPAIRKLIDLGSISHSRLWGEIVKCDMNITDNRICPRCGYTHSNLGNKIEDPENYMVTAGTPIIVHDRNVKGEDAWKLVNTPVGTIGGNINRINCINGTLIAINATGQYMIGRNTNNAICISKDYGNTWNTINAINTTNRRRFKFAISESGKYIAYIPFKSGASSAPGELVVSEDYGETFNLRHTLPSEGFYELSISDYGDDYRAFLVSYFSRWLITRNDEDTVSGTTPASVDNSFSNKTFITSTNGEHVVGKITNGLLYRYLNYGIGNFNPLYNPTTGAIPIHIGNGGGDIFILETTTNKIMYKNTINDIFEEYTNIPNALVGDIVDFDVSDDLQTQVLIESLTPNTPDNRIWLSIDGGDTWNIIGTKLNWRLVNIAKTNPRYILLSVRDGNSSDAQTVYLLDTDVVFNFLTFFNIDYCEDIMPSFIKVNNYSLSNLVAVDKCDQYDYYEYKPGYPTIEECNLRGKHPQAVGVINWLDEYTTLEREISSINRWYGSDGIYQSLIEYNLLKGLEIESSCEITLTPPIETETCTERISAFKEPLIQATTTPEPVLVTTTPEPEHKMVITFKEPLILYYPQEDITIDIPAIIPEPICVRPSHYSDPLILPDPPNAIPTTSNSLVYISNPNNGHITIINPSVSPFSVKHYKTPISTEPATQMGVHGFGGVYGIAVLPHMGYAWVADAELDKIMQIDSNGNITKSIDLSGFGFEGKTPGSIAIDGNLDFWVSLFDSNTFIKFDKRGNYITSFNIGPDDPNCEQSACGDIEFKPSVLDTDTKNNVWVAFNNNKYSALHKYDNNGNFIFAVDNFPLNSTPVDLIVNGKDDSVWVSLPFSHQDVGEIRKYDKNGNLELIISDIYLPGNLSIDNKHGYLWFTNGINDLSYIDNNGDVQTINSPPWKAPHLDNTYINKEQSLEGLSFDNGDNLWIIDSRGNKAYTISNIHEELKFSVINIIPNRKLSWYNDGPTQYMVKDIRFKSAQAFCDWTGYRWGQKYKIPECERPTTYI